MGMVVIRDKGLLWATRALLVWRLYQKHKKAAPLGRKAAPSWVDASTQSEWAPHSTHCLGFPNHRAVHRSLRARV